MYFAQAAPTIGDERTTIGQSTATVSPIDRTWVDLGVTAALILAILRKGWEWFSRQQSEDSAMMQLMFTTLMEDRKQDREERRQLMELLLKRG